MRRPGLAALILLGACQAPDDRGTSTSGDGDGDRDDGGQTTGLDCGAGTRARLTAGGRIEVTGADALDLAGAAVGAGPMTTLPADDVTIECAAADIVPDGYVALGPAVDIRPMAAISDRPFSITLPFKYERLPQGASERHVRVVAVNHLGSDAPYFFPLISPSLDRGDPFASRVTFQTGGFATFQVVASVTAGQAIERRHTYRSVMGVSMGGNAAVRLGLVNHEYFDYIGSLGGDPGMSLRYLLDMLEGFLFGGFCDANDQAAGDGIIGEMCPASQRPVLVDQFERYQNYEAMLFEAGSGTGLTLRRSTYMRGFRDMVRAFGNPAYWNPDNPYTPPGVPLSHLENPNRCSDPVVLSNFYHHRFNPDGAYPVITFCDGGDSPELGLGVFDPGLAQENPFDPLLAVDVNGNGRRDSGEPVLMMMAEPYQDVGADGLADADETGPLGAFDPATNPDPAGDNFHWQRNPLGTERNWRWDEGEPFSDTGLDGVGETCQVDAGPGCFDYGEGDGEFTRNPRHDLWAETDAALMVGNMTADERARVGLYADAGIRDFLLNSLAVNTAAAQMIAERGMNIPVFDGFASLTGAPGERAYDFRDIDWNALPENVYVRYGNPDATQAQIERGDGRHVGTPAQLVNRVMTMFSWVQSRWPNGDRQLAPAGRILSDLDFTSPSTGRVTPYSLFLPPGYDDNPGQTYPVAYFMHGYGMGPDDLVTVSAVLDGYMTNGNADEAERFAKMIIVFVDGRCRDDEGGSDGCETGTWYANAPLGGRAQMEDLLFELVDEIDRTYRTRAPELVEYVP